MSIRAHFDGRKLDQRVQFDRLVQVQDATGNPVPTWTLKGRCWAAVDGARCNTLMLAFGLTRACFRLDT